MLKTTTTTIGISMPFGRALHVPRSVSPPVWPSLHRSLLGVWALQCEKEQENGADIKKLWRVTLPVTIGITWFIALHSIIFCRCCPFYKLKVCGSLALSMSMDTAFLMLFAHFMSSCHILVIISISDFFITIIMVICDKRLQITKSSDNG